LSTENSQKTKENKSQKARLRAFGSLAFRDEGTKSAQNRLINENEMDSLDLPRLDQTFPKPQLSA
jgi:hypothetical protein